MIKTIDNPIFIGGLMKSGTTLVRVLLSQHPCIFGGLETHWFDPDVCGDWQNDKSLRQEYLRKFYDVSREDIKVIRENATDGLDYFDRFMAFCTERAGKRRWLEKSPDNVLYIETIKKKWSVAKFIHVVRDYRDVYASWKKNNKYSLDVFLKHAQRAFQSVKSLWHMQTPFYCEIDYENLVTATTKSMKKLLLHVGEEWVHDIDKKKIDRTEYEKVKRIIGKTGTTLEALQKPIFTDSIGQWKDILTREEQECIEQNLHEPMQKQGWL